MKKIIKNIGLVLSGLAVLSSCNDSFLERTPTHDLNDNSFWTTANDLKTYNNGIYNEAGNNNDYMFLLGFTNGAWSSNTHSVFAYEAQSDNMASMSSRHQWATKIAAGQEVVPNDAGRGGWKWSVLRRINVFFQNYQKVNADETIINEYAGEAYFFRAWFYLDKVQMYGDVPYLTEPLNTDSPELYGERMPRKMVMDSVLRDINKACEYLPLDWDSDSPSRITKGAALALKSRICLYEGTFRKYHSLGDHDKFLNEAVKASEDLMALNKYAIHNTGNPATDYTTLFTSEDLASNDEVILYRKYQTGVLGHRLCGYIMANVVGVTKDLVDDYLCIEADGGALPVGLSASYNDNSIESVLTNRDPRLTQTVLDPRQAHDIFFNKDQYEYPILDGMKGNKSTTGYHAIKYYTAEQDKKGYGKEDHDAPLFRYAEVLLNLAEAKAELGTITQADLDRTINVIRERVAMPALTLNPPMDPKYADEGISSLLVEIRRERRVELSFEQLRYTDLMRWKWGKRLALPVLGMRFEEADRNDPHFADISDRVKTVNVDGKNYIDVFAGTDFENRVFDENKHYYHPIPVNVISKNPAIEQNPNWE